jgi:hypothetical protein
LQAQQLLIALILTMTVLTSAQRRSKYTDIRDMTAILIVEKR